MSRGMRTLCIAACLVASTLSGCATVQEPTVQTSYIQPIPEAELVKVRVVVKPKNDRTLKPDSRIVLTNMAGECATEVRDALMRRLVDNTDYQVVTRDFLDQIMVESEQGWAGKFDSRTAARLGELLSASVFVVGRVAYCGPPDGARARNDGSDIYSILAVLQILDVRTGKVLISSSAEGRYVPDSVRLMVSTHEDQVGATVVELEEPPTPPKSAMGRIGGALGKTWSNLRDGAVIGARTNGSDFQPDAASSAQRSHRQKDEDGDDEDDEDDDDKKKKDKIEVPINYPAFRAAEDLANGFADKFFSRAAWEDVTMWTSPTWSYGKSIRFVKLGHCDKAVELLDGSRAELQDMMDVDVANYLHNMGVSLLCDNQRQEAILKLRSAYRITYDPSTLRMIELASRLDEWDLSVEVDRQPEVEVLVERSSAEEDAVAAPSGEAPVTSP